MTVERVEKVTAVVLRPGKSGAAEMLVFDHPLKEGGSMIQLPAGTLEKDETTEAGALRELFEETGVQGEPVALAGVRDEEWQGQLRRRWIYIVRPPEGLPGEWPYSCDCGTPILFRWMPFDTAQIFEPQQPWVEMAREWARKSSLEKGARS
ncbi:MAG: NUDIX domain-containing protein [SAR202 cluster bacterium]|nr:NUDIX domain-containing protein [SAR202 cluster bacterium]